VIEITYSRLRKRGDLKPARSEEGQGSILGWRFDNAFDSWRKKNSPHRQRGCYIIGARGEKQGNENRKKRNSRVSKKKKGRRKKEKK